MEIDTAGCRAYDRNFIVGGGQYKTGRVFPVSPGGEFSLFCAGHRFWRGIPAPGLYDSGNCGFSGILSAAEGQKGAEDAAVDGAVFSGDDCHQPSV